MFFSNIYYIQSPQKLFDTSGSMLSIECYVTFAPLWIIVFLLNIIINSIKTSEHKQLLNDQHLKIFQD